MFAGKNRSSETAIVFCTFKLYTETQRVIGRLLVAPESKASHPARHKVIGIKSIYPRAYRTIRPIEVRRLRLNTLFLPRRIIHLRHYTWTPVGAYLKRFKTRRPNADLMPARSLKRWPGINPTLGQRVIFVGDRTLWCQWYILFF